MTRKLNTWIVGCLWLLAAACGFAQEAAGPATVPVTAPVTPPAPATDPITAAAPAAKLTLPAIVLDSAHPVVSLDNRARYWIDPTGIKSIDQVEAAGDTLPWALRRPNASYNIDGSALWIEFNATASGRERWYVQLESSGIDRVQLFYRGPDMQWATSEAGDSRPVSQWPLPGRFPTFELSPVSGHAVTYYLRIEHARVDFASPISLYDQSTLLAGREREQFLLGGYFGLAALIGLVSIANAILYRDRNFTAYALYVVVLAIGQLAYLGVGAQHIWDHWLKWNEVATFVLPPMSAAAALWFVQTVTEPARYSKVLDMVVWALIAGLLSAVALDTLLMTRISFGLVLVLTLAAMAVVITLVLLVWTKGDDPSIKFIALGFLPVLVMACFPIARGLSLIAASGLTRYSLAIGAAMEMPILYYALSLRGTRRREAQVRASTLSHVDPLTGLAHARAFLQRLDGAIERATSLKHACALLTIKIANFDAIAAEFGRDAADRALIVAASVLRYSISDVDLAARVADHEFAILLEGPTTIDAALSCGQQIVASGLRPAEALPPGTTLKFRITVALLPDQNLDAAGSLKWLLDALRSMTVDSRKAIRSMNF